MPEILLVLVNFAGVVPLVGLLLEPLVIEFTRHNVGRLEYPASGRARAQEFFRAPQLLDENVCCVLHETVNMC